MAAVSLFVLVLQNSSFVLLTRYSRFSQPPGENYHTSTLVLNQEILKMIFCLVIFAYESKSNDAEMSVSRQLCRVVCQRETLKLIVPAALFTLQNFLVFVALSNLDAMTFQVFSQTKLLSAAVFSVLLLDRRLNVWQWFALGLLTMGVFLSQSSEQRESFVSTLKTVGNASPHPQQPHQQQQQQSAANLTTHAHQDYLLGAAACIISGLSSSFAGVYFEKVVKTTAPSLAVRNIHLSIFGIPFSILSMYILDIVPLYGTDQTFHYWRGYDALTWTLVVSHAVGGLLVAVVVKYADNILKGFATGVAVIVCGVYATLFWGYQPSLLFVFGCVLVIGASVLYHAKDQKQQQPPKK